MKPKVIILLMLCLGSYEAAPQSGLYISPGTNLFIGTGTVFSTDSLVIIPAAGYNITGQNALTRNTSVTHFTSNPYLQRVFHFSATLTLFSGSISVYYRDAELNGIPENTLTLNVHIGGIWTAYNTNVTRDEANNFVTTSGLVNISLNEITLAHMSAPLPLTYTLFNASCTGNKIKLTWKTAQESNTKHFEIERSPDGSAWLSLGNIPAAGNSTVERSYAWTDDQPGAGGQYRIVAHDLDGKKHFSSIIKASCSTDNLFAVYPNPVHQSAIVHINIDEPASVTLRLYDGKGVLIKLSQTNVLRGINLLQLDMANLAPGTYHLVAQWGKAVKAVQLIKQ